MKKSIIKKLVEFYGKELQIDKLQEEAQELALSLHQAKCPTKCPVKAEFKIYDELADVSIMMAQVPYLFDMDRINERVDYKLRRANNKMNL
ncbi:MAG: hypothetical protein GY756_10195 [bacterium]|nr:hypothetical protein [bacterium]